MKPRTYFLIAVLLGTSLLAAHTVKLRIKARPQFVPVVVAAKAIPQGDILYNPEECLTVRFYRVGTEPPLACGNIAELRGKQLVRALDSGTPCTFRDLNAQDISRPLPTPLRAMTLRITVLDPNLIDLPPGLRVDLLITLDVPNEGGRVKFSRIFVQNALVLAVGRMAREECPGKGPFPSVLTVGVTPEDAEKVAWVTASGSVVVLLRRPGDDKIVETKGVYWPRDPEPKEPS